MNVSLKLEEITEEESNDHSRKKSLLEIDSLEWEVDDLKKLELLNYLHDWNFPIFQFYEISSKNILSQVRIFQKDSLNSKND
jgi:hypothetical protein